MAEHHSIIRDHRELAVFLPKGEGAALGDVDLKRARIKLQHRRIRDPRIGFQAVTHASGIKEQEGGTAVDAACGQHLILRQLLAAVDRNGCDSETRGIGQCIARVVKAVIAASTWPP